MRDFLAELLECSVSMSAFALLLMALTPLLSKRYAAKWLYYAWLVIVVGLILPFRPRFGDALIRVDAAAPSVRHTAPVNAAGLAAQAGSASRGFSAFSPEHLLTVLWLTGAASLLLYHALRHLRFLRTVKRWGIPVKDPRTLEALERIKNDMGVPGPVKLLLCPCVSGPMMTGFKRPVILLPKTGFSPDELQFVLRHELVHFRRKDLWYKGLVVLAAAVHWFNPVVYLTAKAIASQCEISCDAEVVKGIGPDGRRQYGKTILGAAKKQSGTVFTSNFYGGKRDMRRRIYSIMDPKKKKAGIAVLCLILIGALTTGTVFAFNGNAEDTSQSEAASIQTVAEKWAEAVKSRDGRAQFDLLSPACQSSVYDEYSSNGWSTGLSSPWVESYGISVNGNSAVITFQFATSTGPADSYKQTLTFVKRGDEYDIDSFSNAGQILQIG